jgi:hypothetical protein
MLINFPSGRIVPPIRPRGRGTSARRRTEILQQMLGKRSLRVDHVLNCVWYDYMPHVAMHDLLPLVSTLTSRIFVLSRPFKRSKGPYAVIR